MVLWILSADSQFRLPDFHRLWSAFPKQFSYRLSIPYTVRNPDKLGSSVWPISLSLAATQEIEFSFFSSGYLDVSVHRVPFHTLWIGVWIHEVFSCGFPHSDICGSRDICSSPQLFAAYHVLHRLLVPRHSPCALSCLTFFTSLTSNVVAILHFFFVCCSMCFFLFDSFFTCSVFKVLMSVTFVTDSGDCEIRTRDPLLARQVLSQLS